MVTILTGDCREVLKTLPDASVNCCVTSPPYWGLRDYGHAGQIGLERTPEEYVVNLVAVFREVRRAMREDGTLWLNLGDSYATGAGKVGDCPGGGEQGARWSGNRGDRPGSPKHAPGAIGPMTQPNHLPLPGLKPKDLVGIPWRVAFALQADGWWLRSDIIWHKPNPMPESVTDRPTKSHEYIFLMTKSERYYYDAKAILEPVQSGPSDVRKMLESKDRIDAKHFHTDAGPRVRELFSDDSRYRESGLRDLLRGIVDDAALEAVQAARDRITSEIPAIAVTALRDAVKLEMEKAAQRGLATLKKLFVGFDPRTMTDEQRAWLQRQLVAAGHKGLEVAALGSGAAPADPQKG